MSERYQEELAKEAGKAVVRAVATGLAGAATLAFVGFLVAGPPGAVVGAKLGAAKGAALGGLGGDNHTA